MSHHTDPFAPAVHTAHEWLRSIADDLGTDDRMFTHRAVRAWLHTVRDRIGVTATAHLGAQLPEILRGILYEGWMPGHVPVPHDVRSFVTQFARAAGVSPDEAASLAGAVTDALVRLFSPGQIDHILAVLPVHLRDVLLGTDLSGVLAGAAVLTPQDWDQVATLEARVQALTDAVATLTHGLETPPGGETDSTASVSAAQQAHRILLSEGLTQPQAPTH